MGCSICDKEISKELATTYMAINQIGMITDYAKVLCNECLNEKNKNPIF